MSRSERAGIYAMLVLATLVWGATFNVAKYTVHYLSPAVSGALRYTVASVLMLVFMAVRWREVGDVFRRNWRVLCVMSLVGVSAFNIFFFVGMGRTSPTNGSLIQSTNPLVTALIAALFFGERMRRGYQVGTIVSFAGVAALILGGTVQRLELPNLGDLSCLVANICLAVYSVLAGRMLKGSTPAVTTGITTVIGTVPLWIAAFQTRPRPDAALFQGLPSKVYAAVLFIGVLASVVAYVFWNHGVSRLGVAETAVFFYLVPVFTVITSVVLGQRVTALQLAAGAVVMSGLVISSWGSRGGQKPAANSRQSVTVGTTGSTTA